ncbi:MAG: hypothetical protein U9N56_02995 [Actinomycetota bacterium]|nr:hypothetical protein [Actinomycetota bacterium]
MLSTRAKVKRSACAHTGTINVTAAGVDRIVCESCGYVSFRFLSDPTPEIEIQRAMFARETEREPQPVKANV